MVKKSSTKGDRKEPIYTWSFESSQPRAGGDKVTYIARLNEDGTVSCNCPGWVFCKDKGAGRSCKHLRAIGSEPKETYSKWKKGELSPKATGAGSSPVGFKRVVEWED